MDLKRIITSGRYIPEIDGLRFVAILVVVLYHIPSNFIRTRAIADAQPALFGAATDILAFLTSCVGPVYFLGVEGVLLFFTISGFILSLPFARQHLQHAPPVSLQKYFVRRLTRLEPPYIVAMSLMLLVGCLLGRYRLVEQLPHLAASLLYVHNIVYGASSTINNAAWSLEVEVQFYILAPLLCWLVFRRPALGCLLIPAAIVASASVAALVPLRIVTVAGYLHYFLAGVATGGAYVARPAWFETRSSWADIGFLGTATLVGLVAHGGRVPREIILPCCFGGMLICALKSRWVSRLLAFPLFARLGGMCYTTYLYHGRLLTLPIVLLLSGATLTNKLTSDVMLASLTLVPFVFAASIPLFLLFEKPFMNPNWPREMFQWLRGLSGGRYSRVAESPSAALDQTSRHSG